MASRRLRLTAQRAAIVSIVLVGARASAQEPAKAPVSPTISTVTDTPTSGDAVVAADTEPEADTEPDMNGEGGGEPAAEQEGEEEEPEAEAGAGRKPAKKVDNRPNEVRVRGAKKREATAPKETLTTAEIRRLPGAFGDAFRAIEALPGVTPIVSGIPYFFVRGAPPGNTGFFIDDVRVPGLFHLGIGPAVMYPALIHHVDLYKGAYPVSFGRYAGGVLSAETIAPASRTRADWTLRLFDAGGLVETPFGGGGEGTTPKGSFLVSGRYGYPGLLLSLLAPNAGLAYWDYQTRATYNLSSRDKISVFAFGSYDSISEREDTEGIPNPNLTEILNIQFHRVELRWEHQTSPSGYMRTSATLGYDRTGSEGFAARALMAGVRTQAQERLSRFVQIRGGADATIQNYDFRLGRAAEGRPPRPDESPSGAESGLQKDANMGLWLDTPLKVTPKFEVTPGVRADVYTSRGVGKARAIPAFDPRVTTRLKIGPVYHIGAVGIAHQPASFPVPIPALSFAQLRRGLQSGYHLSQGLEFPLPLDFTGTVSGYLHTYTGLVDLGQQCDVDDPRCDPASSRGRSIGLEALVKRNLGKRVSGWIGYTLSRSTRDSYDITIRRFRSRLSEFDRTHVFNAVLSVDLGKGWRIGGRYTGYSGIPYSTVSDALLPNARTPPFHRLDLRAEKRWITKTGNSFAVTAEMFNTLIQKESIGTTCRGAVCEPEKIGPIAIPSLGFEGTL